MVQKDCSLSLIKKPCPRRQFYCRRCQTKMKNTNKVWRVSTNERVNSTPLFFPQWSQKLFWGTSDGAGLTIIHGQHNGLIENNVITKTPHVISGAECMSAIGSNYSLLDDATAPITNTDIDAGSATWTAGSNSNVDAGVYMDLYLYWDEVWKIAFSVARKYSVFVNGSLVENQIVGYYLDADYISEESGCTITDPVDFILDSEGSRHIVHDPLSPVEHDYSATAPSKFTVEIVDYDS